MKKYIHTLLLLFPLIPLLLNAQNTNVTYRSKMTFTGQSVANVWGYTSGGKEYALIGASQGLIIADITNPDAPQQIVQLPGPNNLWKEIRTYGHYAYVTTEGGQGLQIVDLSNLPDPNPPQHFYTGDGPIAGQLWRIHALQVDEKKGFLYIYGARKPDNTALLSSGAVVLDLNADPYNPKYAGKFDQLGYIHDGYAENDTLYSGHIYSGQFAVVDMQDKSNPKLLATQNTPNNFTHNTWRSRDGRTLFTTDERENSFLAAFDISDLDNIRLLDKIQSNPGSNSIVHNTHILNNFAITAWYKDGFTIVDVSRPDNLVQVGNYDTYPNGSGNGFEGCWGVYPFFPSGNIIASTITALGTNNGELWVLTPNYLRACYLEGKISNGLTGTPLTGAQVEIVGSSPLARENSGPDGRFKMGQEQDGYFTVRISKSGYQTQEVTVSLQRGNLRTLNIALFPAGNLAVSGKVMNAATNLAVPSASVTFSNNSGTWETVTDGNGAFNIPDLQAGIYNISAWATGTGYTIRYNQKITSNKNITLMLAPLGKSFQGGPGTGQSMASVFPNPFRQSALLRWAPTLSAGQITAVDQLGRVVARQAVEAGETTYELGAAWPAGLYVLRIEWADGGAEVFKVEKR